MKYPPLLVPLVTAFTDDTVTMSEMRMTRLVRYYRDSGVKGFVVGTEMGEHLALSHAERKELLELVVREARDLPVIVNATSFTTALMLDLSQHAERHGAVAVVFRSPVSYALTDDEARSLSASMRRHSGLPVSLIDTPERVALAEAETDRRFEIHSLVHSPHHRWAMSNVPVTCEFSSVLGMCTPLAVLGADRAYRLMDRWAQAESVAAGLWKLAGPIRFAKAVTDLFNFDVGKARNPVHPLSVQGKSIMSRLWDASEV